MSLETSIVTRTIIALLATLLVAGGFTLHLPAVVSPVPPHATRTSTPTRMPTFTLGQPVLLAEGFDPAWSPDGARIAYLSTLPFTSGLVAIMDADGSNSHTLI